MEKRKRHGGKEGEEESAFTCGAITSIELKTVWGTLGVGIAETDTLHFTTGSLSGGGREG